MMQYIENLVGIENAPMASYIAMAATALIAILILWLIIRLIRKPRFASSRRNKQARLAITDAATVDSKRRLVLLRRDDVEHLIMIGGPTDIIIETDIRRQKPAVSAVPLETAAPTARAPAKPVAAKPIAESKPAPVTPPKPSAIPSTIPGVSKVGAAVGSLTGAATSAVSATANTASSAVSSTTSAASSATDKLTDLTLPEKKEPSIEDDMNALLDEISTPEVDPPKKA